MAVHDVAQDMNNDENKFFLSLLYFYLPSYIRMIPCHVFCHKKGTRQALLRFYVKMRPAF